MMSKKVVLALLIFLAFIFSGIAYAEENPFQGLTQEQVIQKYFEGRQLDTIEGIWVNLEFSPWIVIKSNLIDPNKKYGDSDYLMVEYSSSSSTFVDRIKKTQYTSCFRLNSYTSLRLISPNALNQARNVREGFIYTRIYPTELK